MRKLVITSAIALALSVTSANADVDTLNALKAAGIILTTEQAASIENATCSATDCQALTDEIAALVVANSDNEAAVQTILSTASQVHPAQSLAFGDAAVAAAPALAATILAATTQAAPTAAGGDIGGFTGPTGTNQNQNASIPSAPASGGAAGSSSPN
ncbi:hypothetical protein [Thiosulfativibrio zosterae]|uniref:Uncharacterized protein n=1 Tax=Thiosulfativibrio zosterae TaxID=2675053 RepID=A0A6F8PQT2_9GAMM|nr:hypothetical protein [Thiosulfativibrio zosterae]BBP44481.1 hypothetical protein THMIRHAT_22270 [Thiosulfativibrio zosterae]